MTEHATRRLLLVSCGGWLALAAALPFQAAPSLFAYPVIEDGYYALTAARHLGIDRLLSVDGVHLTSGVQPLWVFLLAPFAWVADGDRTVFLRLALAVHWVLYGLTAIVVATIARRAAPAIGVPQPLAAYTAALLYLANTRILEVHFNGLETGLALLAYGATALLILEADWRRRTTLARAGVLCGVLVLARVDAVFFVALLAPIAIDRREAGWRTVVCGIVAIPVLAALVSAPWWIYNVVVFGRLMPSSGVAQLAGDFSPGGGLVMGLYVVGRMVPVPFDYLVPTRFEHGAVVVLVASAVAAAAWWRRGGRVDLSDRLTGRLARLAVLFLIHSALLCAWYGVTSHAWWMFLRYSAPIVVVSVPALALALLSAGRSRVPVPVIAVTVLVVGSMSAALARYSPLGVKPASHLTQLELTQQTVPAGERVAALQTGMLGYFRDGVVNLDGKVNEEALSRRGDLVAYCREQGIRWVVDRPDLVETYLLSRSSRSEWTLVEARRDPICDACWWQAYAFSGK